MTSNPIISVIMPVYNCEKYLKESIDSVLSQTFRDFELIIINDGSDDGSKDIILSYKDERIVYIENEKNLKIIETLNKGIAAARGKYLARMDSDDRCLSHRLERQFEYLESNPALLERVNNNAHVHDLLCDYRWKHDNVEYYLEQQKVCKKT